MGSRVFSSHGQSATNDAIFALGFIQAAQSWGSDFFFNNSVLKKTGAFSSYAQGSHCLQRGNSFGSFSFRWFKQISYFQCLVLKGLKEANLILLPQAQEHPEATGREECGFWGDKEKPGFYSILARGRLSRWNKVETLKRQKLMSSFLFEVFFNGFLH